MLCQLSNQPFSEELLQAWSIGLENLGPEQMERGFRWAMQNSKYSCMPMPGEVREHGLDGEAPELRPLIIKPVPDPDCARCKGQGYSTPGFKYVPCSCLHMPATTDRLLTLTKLKAKDKAWARAYVLSHRDRYLAMPPGYCYQELLEREGYLDPPPPQMALPAPQGQRRLKDAGTPRWADAELDGLAGLVMAGKREAANG